MKKGILVVSFGTTYPIARKRAIETIETVLSNAFPDVTFYRAFTSQIVMERIRQKEHLTVLNVEEALQEMASQGVEQVFIQSTHVIPGEEYDKITGAAKQFKHLFHTIKIGKPLLWSQEDFQETADILERHYHLADLHPEQAVIMMGHGSEHTANECYQRFQTVLEKRGLSQVFVSTVEGTPDFKETREVMKNSSFSQITLIPFMVVAGDHVQNDLFGTDNSSWKSQLLADGYQVDGFPSGLGELPEIQNLYLKHLQAAMFE